MFTMNFDDEMIEQLAEKIATLAYEKLNNKLSIQNNLPLVLTREEAMNVLRCGSTTMSELMRRPDFPVIREFGVKIPTHMLMKWIERNTNWVEKNTNYFEQEAI
ncbi:transcriptional regulator [Bacillus phage vB_Bacillus_1020A]|uniref:hypothetical protein n=1 Tax=Robertmurraya sp. DFI.2.37 TaxID=3031819 RepID=UPI00124803F7|nr:hypothetical protein [Robertmurraya sp. DFI.2.37]MDF1511057.1 hypothetical protein [Robertmurraya sp. DFI.2.37]QIW89325.1 transcriptional regulator [Bacillus phage vB_Bacillus_1020A]